MTIRMRYLPRVMDVLRTHQLSIDPEDITKLILDSSYLPEPNQEFENLCRNFVFKMHHTRAKLLGGSSMYRLGS
jgi:hypothetical protein